MNDIMKIVKSHEECGSLIKDVKRTIQNEAKEQKDEFLSMLWDVLGVNLLWNLLTGKGATRADKGIISAGQDF